MSLNALQVALQGLFPLTPIAAAVQGLIEQIQEEQRQQQVAGQRGRPGSTTAPDMAGQPITRETDQEILAKAIDKWEAIERVQARTPNPPSPPPPTPPTSGPAPDIAPPTPGPVRLAMPSAFEPSAAPPMATPDPQAERAAQTRRRNAVALALILAELD